MEVHLHPFRAEASLFITSNADCRLILCINKQNIDARILNFITIVLRVIWSRVKLSCMEDNTKNGFE